MIGGLPVELDEFFIRITRANTGFVNRANYILQKI